MSKKKKLAVAVFILAVIALNVFIVLHRGAGDRSLTFRMTVESAQNAVVQVYYTADDSFSEPMSQKKEYTGNGNPQELEFTIAPGTKAIRIDLGDRAERFMISELGISFHSQSEELLLSQDQMELHEISAVAETSGKWLVDTDGNDPYFVFDVDTESLSAAAAQYGSRVDFLLNAAMLLVLDGGVAVAFFFRKKVFSLPVELFHNRGLILSLSKNDFKTKYAGSYLGIVWAFVQPVVTILVYWFVFSVGLRAGNVMDYPFVLYLISGIVPWFFFQDALNGGTNALIEYNYLVKKVVFKISVLPIVKIISALYVHIFFVVFSLIVCACYGYYPSLYTLQLIYYSACNFMLVLGLVYATSAIVIFFRDLSQIIGIFLQVGIWMTPIMWDLTILADHPLLMKLFKLNPMYYIVSGYRDSMLGHVWFTEHWGWTLYFWMVTIVLFGLGTVIFKRLKVHFADVL